MKLQGPPFDADPELICDWIELRCMSSLSLELNFSDLSRVWEANKESEETSPTGDDMEFDDWLARVFDVIQRRIECLDATYPFKLLAGDVGLKFSGAPRSNTGANVYLLCLFLSAAPETEVFVEKVHIPPAARDLFQAVSAWAAAGIVHGNSYALAWPRPEGTNYLTSLAYVFSTLMADGDASAVASAPPGSSGREKDGGIDVVAWRPRIDNSAGKITLIGQVASGNDWRGKPVKHYIDQLTQLWLVPSLALSPMPALFIPFSVRRIGNATYQQQMRLESATYGAIFHREVLPAYAAKGIELSTQTNHVHRHNEVKKLEIGKRVYVRQLRQAQRLP